MSSSKSRKKALDALSNEMRMAVQKGNYSPLQQTQIPARDICKLLRFLHRWPLRGRDITLKNMKVSGVVQGKLIRAATGLQFEDCDFNGPIDLSYSTLNHLVMRKCRFISDIDLRQLRLENNFVFEGNELFGNLNLSGSRIDGNVKIEGSLIAPVELADPNQCISTNALKLLCENHNAISLNAMQIGGVLNFTSWKSPKGLLRPTCVFGRLSCLSSNIGSQLLLAGAGFYNPKGKTIECHGTRIGQDLMLCNGFTSIGFADFQGTIVKGQINLRGASLTGQENDFIMPPPNSRRKHIKFTRQEIKANHPIKINKWVIPTILNFVDYGMARFHNRFGPVPSIENRYVKQFRLASDNRKSPALSLRFVTCRQDVVMRDLAHRPKGGVILSHATFGRICDDRTIFPDVETAINPITGETYRLATGYLYLNGLEYSAFSNRKIWKSDDDIAARDDRGFPDPDLGVRRYINRYPKEDVEHRHTALYREDWLKCQPPEYLSSAFLKQPWLQCAKVLNESAQSKQAKHLAILMERAETDAMKVAWINPGMARLRHQFRYYRRKLLRGGLMNYGYSPIKPIIIAVGVFLVSWTGYVLLDFFAPSMIVPTDMKYVTSSLFSSYDPSTKAVISNYQTYSSLYYTLDQLVPIVDFGYSDSWGIRGQNENDGSIQIILWHGLRAGGVLLSVTGWFLTTLALIGLTQSTFKSFKPAF